MPAVPTAGMSAGNNRAKKKKRNSEHERMVGRRFISKRTRTQGRVEPVSLMRVPMKKGQDPGMGLVFKKRGQRRSSHDLLRRQRGSGERER